MSARALPRTGAGVQSSNVKIDMYTFRESGFLENTKIRNGSPYSATVAKVNSKTNVPNVVENYECTRWMIENFSSTLDIAPARHGRT